MMHRHDRKVFFAHIRESLFRGKFSQYQVDGLNTLLDVWEEHYSAYPRAYLPYCLATAYHETAQTMQPVRETLAKSDRQAIARLSKSQYTRNKVYWHIDRKTGQSYYGRGYVQLTWKANYEKAAQNLGIDFVADPNSVMDPLIAARILYTGCIEGWFTGKKLADYNKEKGFDWRNARRIVNGMDRASLIASYAREFDAALEAAGKSSVMDDDARDVPEVEELVTGKPAHKSTTIIAGTAALASSGIKLAAEQVEEVQGALNLFSSLFGLSVGTILLGVIAISVLWGLKERVLKSRRDGV